MTVERSGLERRRATGTRLLVAVATLVCAALGWLWWRSDPASVHVAEGLPATDADRTRRPAPRAPALPTPPLEPPTSADTPAGDTDIAVTCPPIPIDDAGWAAYAPAEWASADSAVTVQAERGRARIHWQVVDSSEGGWLSGPGVAPRAVRLEWRDGTLGCVVAEPSGESGTITGSINPCEADYMLTGCRTAGFAYAVDGCRFTLTVLAEGPCRIRAQPAQPGLAYRPDPHEAVVDPVAAETTHVVLARPARMLGVRLDGLAVVESFRGDDALQAGDVVVTVNGIAVSTRDEVAALLAETTPWDVVVEVERDGDLLAVPLHPLLQRESVDYPGEVSTMRYHGAPVSRSP